MSSIHMITGENAFMLRNEVLRWKNGFKQKHGEENLSEIDASGVRFADILNEISAQPFLAEKRLICVRGIPSMEKEQVDMLFQSIHPDVILLIVEPKPDKRTAVTKELLKKADVRECAPVKGAALLSWLKTYASQHGAILQQKEAALLIEYVGEHQDLLASEVERLALQCASTEITSTDIEMSVIPTEEGVVWNISDALASNKKEKALSYTARMLDRGGDMYGLWAILISMVKNIAAVKAAKDAGITSGKDIADATGIHPFAVRNIAAYAGTVSMEDVRQYLGWMSSADLRLKTGDIRATDEAQQELRSLIDAAIMRCP